jgi:ABC-type antimicrobial peptide transport system permease subunit
MRFVVRAGHAAGTIAQPVRELLTQVDATQPAYEFEPLERALADSIAPRRFQLSVLVLFAASALGLALIGIHGVMAWSVEQRSREIGVRMALGARRSEIVRLVVRQGMRLVAIGIAAGVVAAAGLTRVMASLLYGVKPGDIPTLVAATVAMAATALAACWFPARRAARVDPVVALRGE